MLHVGIDRFGILNIRFLQLADCRDAEGIDLAGGFPGAVSLEIAVKLFVFKCLEELILRLHKMIQPDGFVSC